MSGHNHCRETKRSALTYAQKVVCRPCNLLEGCGGYLLHEPVNRQIKSSNIYLLTCNFAKLCCHGFPKKTMFLDNFAPKVPFRNPFQNASFNNSLIVVSPSRRSRENKRREIAKERERERVRCIPLADLIGNTILSNNEPKEIDRLQATNLETPIWGQQRGVTPICSNFPVFFRFVFLVFSNTPICSDCSVLL